VHGHWLLARLARLYPQEPFAVQARAALAASLTPDHIAAEVRYLEGKGRVSFERPYGLAWLLQLDAELSEWDDPQARAWAEAVHPLARACAARLTDWLPKLTHPIRIGEPPSRSVWHSTGRSAPATPRARAFSLRPCAGSISRIATARSATSLRGRISCRPCLAEADLVGRVLPAAEFASWLAGFLPDLPRDGRADWLDPGIVTDPSDPKLAHLDGLNLSRAGCWKASRRACRATTRAGRPSSPRRGATATLPCHASRAITMKVAIGSAVSRPIS